MAISVTAASTDSGRTWEFSHKDTAYRIAHSNGSEIVELFWLNNGSPVIRGTRMTRGESTWSVARQWITDITGEAPQVANPAYSLAGATQVTGGYARNRDGDTVFTFTSDSGETFVVYAYASSGSPQVDRLDSASAAERAYFRTVQYWERQGVLADVYEG